MKKKCDSEAEEKKLPSGLEDLSSKPEKKQPEIYSVYLETRKIKTFSYQNTPEEIEAILKEFNESCPQPEREFAARLLSEKKINITRLQKILGSQRELFQKGMKISLEELLLEESFLTAKDVHTFKEEAETKRLPTFLPFFESQEIVEEKYRILEKLGSGETGAIYKVEHLLLFKKIYALKVMHPCFSCNIHNYDLFVAEVEKVMELKHRNILSIVEFGVLPNKSPYILTEYSCGRTLKSLLGYRWKWDLDRCLAVMTQVLQGLLLGHKNHIIHSHLKPSNILIENFGVGDELIQITDFGLAKLWEKGENIDTLTHGSIEALSYMAPEQACRGNIDVRSDIYSLGIILYEMLTGRPPFHSETLSDMLFQQMFTKPLPPSAINPILPLEINDIVLRMLEKEPERRFASCEELLPIFQKHSVPFWF